MAIYGAMKNKLWLQVHPPLNGVTLDRKELAERWRCCVETIKRREKARAITALKLGRLVRYRLSDIEAVEAQAEVK
jgi:hypothetical protein